MACFYQQRIMTGLIESLREEIRNRRDVIQSMLGQMEACELS